MKYEFTVEGDIVGKERPRVNTNTLRVYTPNKTKDYEFLIRQYFKIKYPKFEMIEGRLQVVIVAYLKIPKSTQKKKIESMLENKESPIKKPDIDNIAKVILDAMNGFVFKDDNQVSKITVEKRYAIQERVDIIVEEY